MREIEASHFTRWDVSADGTSIRMTVTDADGALTGVVLPSDALTGLVMTLPTIVEKSLRRQHGDPSFKLVYPLAGWTIEQAAGSGQLIVTFETPDGFKVSFAAAPQDLDEIGATARSGRRRAVSLN